MKSIILLLSLFISSISFACPDLSGNYKSGDRYHYRFEQTGCEKLIFVSWTSSSDIKVWNFMLDNVFRSYGLVEGAKDLSAFHFTQNALEQTAILTLITDGTLAMYSLRVTYSLTESRNIVIRTIAYNALGNIVQDSSVELQREASP